MILGPPEAPTPSATCPSPPTMRAGLVEDRPLLPGAGQLAEMSVSEGRLNNSTPVLNTTPVLLPLIPLPNLRVNKLYTSS